MERSELSTFDGRDNRKELLTLLGRLGSDRRRKRFLESLIPHSLKGFQSCPMKVSNNCDVGSAYFMLIGVCNELGVSINHAAQLLEREVRQR